MNISVLIATYGNYEWGKLGLGRAVASVERQGGAHCSFIYEQDMGIAQVRNAAAKKATGDWFCFLDADDELAPRYLDAMRRAYERERGDGPLLLTPAVNYVVRGRKTHSHFQPEQDLRDGNWLAIGTLISRNLFFEVGGFKEWGLYEDWDLWLRCHLAGARIVKVPDAVYLAHYSRTSRNRSARREERNYWHQRIGHANLPDYYDSTTPEEDAAQSVAGVRKMQYA